MDRAIGIPQDSTAECEHLYRTLEDTDLDYISHVKPVLHQDKKSV